VYVRLFSERAWSVEMLRQFLAGVGIDGRTSLVAVFELHVRRLVELAVVRRRTTRACARLLRFTQNAAEMKFSQSITTKQVLPALSGNYTTRTPCAVERDARCVPLVRGSIRATAWVRLRKSNYVKIIPTHMMIREIIPGRQQRARRCPL